MPERWTGTPRHCLRELERQRRAVENLERMLSDEIARLNQVEARATELLAAYPQGLETGDRVFHLSDGFVVASDAPVSAYEAVWPPPRTAEGAEFGPKSLADADLHMRNGARLRAAHRPGWDPADAVQAVDAEVA